MDANFPCRGLFFQIDKCPTSKTEDKKIKSTQRTGKVETTARSARGRWWPLGGGLDTASWGRHYVAAVARQLVTYLHLSCATWKGLK